MINNTLKEKYIRNDNIYLYKKIMTYNKNQSFGDLSLILNKKRAATAVAANTKVYLITMHI